MAARDVVIASMLQPLCQFFLEDGGTEFFFTERSDDDDLIVAAVGAAVEMKNDYINQVVQYSDLDFKSHFRLCRSSVERLMAMLRLNEVKIRKSGVPKEKGLLLSLWLLGNQESFRSVAARFGVGTGHAHREFMTFCSLLKTLSHLLIQWPRGAQITRAVAEFNELRGPTGFPDVLGCIDGVHVPYLAPTKEKSAYSNSTAIILQGVCDANLRFMDVFAGLPGSCSNAFVFQSSALAATMESDPNTVPVRYHLLGDTAYPLTVSLMTPYADDGNITAKMAHFNEMLHATHTVIHQAFGQLFGRFRRLGYLNMVRRDKVSDVIIATCVLHNLCILHEDDTPDIDDQYGDDSKAALGTNEAENLLAFDAAVCKRNAIAELLFLQRPQ